MDAVQGIRVGKAQPSGDATANVSTLGAKLGISQVLGHQLVPHPGHPLDLHAPVLGVVGEPEAGQRRRNNIEGIGCVSTVAGGVGQQRDNLGHLKETTGPPVGDD